MSSSKILMMTSLLHWQSSCSWVLSSVIRILLNKCTAQRTSSHQDGRARDECVSQPYRFVWLGVLQRSSYIVRRIGMSYLLCAITFKCSSVFDNALGRKCMLSNLQDRGGLYDEQLWLILQRHSVLQTHQQFELYFTQASSSWIAFSLCERRLLFLFIFSSNSTPDGELLVTCVVLILAEYTNICYFGTAFLHVALIDVENAL